MPESTQLHRVLHVVLPDDLHREADAVAFSRETLRDAVVASCRDKLNEDIRAKGLEDVCPTKGVEATVQDNADGMLEGPVLRVLVDSTEEAVELTKWLCGGVGEERAKELVGRALALCSTETPEAPLTLHVVTDDNGWAEGIGRTPEQAWKQAERAASEMFEDDTPEERWRKIGAALAEYTKGYTITAPTPEAMRDAIRWWSQDSSNLRTMLADVGLPQVPPVPEPASFVSEVVELPPVSPEVLAYAEATQMIVRRLATLPVAEVARLAAGLAEGRSLTLSTPPEEDVDRTEPVAIHLALDSMGHGFALGRTAEDAKARGETRARAWLAEVSDPEDAFDPSDLGETIELRGSASALRGFVRDIGLPEDLSVAGLDEEESEDFALADIDMDLDGDFEAAGK